MRPIAWGLVLTFGGIFSSVLLGLVYDIVFLEKYPYDGIVDTSGNSYYVNVPPFYNAMYNIARFAMFFSLPLAMVIEALKGRKVEAKENEGA